MLDDVVAADAAGPGGGLGEGGEHADHGGLPGAVGAEDAQDGAGAGVQVDVVDRHEVAEVLGDALGLDGVVGGMWHDSSWDGVQRSMMSPGYDNSRNRGRVLAYYSDWRSFLTRFSEIW
nr:hypothetical protein GCM10025732_22150 [Glycomyces mayteni]